MCVTRFWSATPHRIFQVMDYLDFGVYACAAHADTELNSVGNRWLFQLWFFPAKVMFSLCRLCNQPEFHQSMESDSAGGRLTPSLLCFPNTKVYTCSYPVSIPSGSVLVNLVVQL